MSKRLNALMMTGNPGMAGLEPPNADASAHSQRLCGLIRDEISGSGGKINFQRFMELALYAQGLGYYSAGAYKIGEQGDFVTAPEISPLFSRCLARQCHQILDLLGNADILEIGAGSGTMACDILMELEQLGVLPDRYFILETSADLRERQRVLFRQRIPHLIKHVHWLDRLPGNDFAGVVLANEVLDAMPAHRIRISMDSEQEYFVRMNNEDFEWSLENPDNQEIQQRITTIRKILGNNISDKGYSTEINLAAEAWIRSVADILDQGLVLIIDYGFPRHEFYHPDRSDGTLMCHYRHHAHADPLIFPGLQDVTSHIDFTAIAEAGHEAGLTVAGYTNQGHFLLACGITDLVNMTDANGDLQQSKAGIKQAQEIKKLTLPHEMGELFKVLALTRGLDTPLLGFSLKDDRGRL